MKCPDGISRHLIFLSSECKSYKQIFDKFKLLKEHDPAVYVSFKIEAQWDERYGKTGWLKAINVEEITKEKHDDKCGSFLYRH